MYMNLNTHLWKWFNIEKLFIVNAGKYYNEDEYSEGYTPYCSASAVNNGVGKKIDIEPDFEGNKIVIGKVGCNTFYQNKPFCATSDVNVLTPRFEMSELTALFIVSVINKSENYKWSYGRQCRVGDTKRINIKLPVSLNDDLEPEIDPSKTFSKVGYIPDFKFMEQYMLTLRHKKIITKNIKNENLLDIKNWKEFKLCNLFDKIYKSTAYVKSDLSFFKSFKPGRIGFISRTDLNNGCDGYVLLTEVDKIENGNAIIIGDTTSTIYYQEQDFVTGDHIVVCRANWMNKYTALFVKALLEKERYKYNYGRAFKMDLIKNTIIKLPVLKNGEEYIVDSDKKYSIEGYIPDWKWMENYMKSLPYGDRID